MLRGEYIKFCSKLYRLTLTAVTILALDNNQFSSIWVKSNNLRNFVDDVFVVGPKIKYIFCKTLVEF